MPPRFTVAGQKFDFLIPVPFACTGTSFWRVDRPRPADGQLSSGQIRPVTPGFFKTLAIRHIDGRDFTDADTGDSVPVAIVTEELVRQQFPDGRPLGRRIRFNASHTNGRTDVEWTIVGVVGNLRSSLDGPVRQSFRARDPARQPHAHALRSDRAGPVDARPESHRGRAVAGTRSTGPGSHARGCSGQNDCAAARGLSLLVAAFAGLALALAAVGVYGVMAYSVRERMQEIGIRMALGATAAQVFRLVIGQALRLVLFGIVAGLVAAALLTRMLTRLLFEVEPLDGWTFAATAVLLLIIATVASYLPARRGMRLAPVDALRTN